LELSFFRINAVDEKEKINPRLFNEAEITNYVKNLLEMKILVTYEDEKYPLLGEIQKEEATTYSIKYRIPIFILIYCFLHFFRGDEDLGNAEVDLYMIFSTKEGIFNEDVMVSPFPSDPDIRLDDATKITPK
jgi:hypothetical protein